IRLVLALRLQGSLETNSRDRFPSIRLPMKHKCFDILPFRDPHGRFTIKGQDINFGSNQPCEPYSLNELLIISYCSDWNRDMAE
ncbi:hypothetical protein KUCAC02_011980, partial [Chaenocephalus aceratus]